VVGIEREARGRQSQIRRRINELRDRIRHAEETLEGPIQWKTERIEIQTRRLEDAAHTDALSNTLNRLGMDGRLRDATTRSRAENAPVGVIMCDIDHFKVVNDTFGHLKGDEVIARFGRLLQKGRRREDSVARWGGEEFMILLPGCPLGPATGIAQAMCDDLRALAFDQDGRSFRVTASFGVAAGQIRDLADGADVMALVAQADRRLYVAKGKGRDQVIGDVELAVQTAAG
jgi:diguanylate cyclase (GGDEF)-like protein